MPGAVIRYSEIFYSLQGEGRYAGYPSVFLRTFGCNFCCHGFSQPKAPALRAVPQDMPYHRVPLEKLTDIRDVPVPEFGCDSAFSWAARYKPLTHLEPVETIAERLLAALPQGRFQSDVGSIHLVVTGGEPLLGWQPALAKLLRTPPLDELRNITFETNGTQPLTPELAQAFVEKAERHPLSVHWSVSPKLSLSGESWDNAIRPEVVATYTKVPHTELSLKFVVSDADDADEAQTAIKAYAAHGIRPDAVFFMPVGAHRDTYEQTRETVAELAMARGFQFSPRLQVDLFGNRNGT